MLQVARGRYAARDYRATPQTLFIEQKSPTSPYLAVASFPVRYSIFVFDQGLHPCRGHWPLTLGDIPKNAIARRDIHSRMLVLSRDGHTGAAWRSMKPWRTADGQIGGARSESRCRARVEPRLGHLHPEDHGLANKYNASPLRDLVCQQT
jgi:hypothetical protein